MRSDIQVPLPQGWPNRIRSGVIHVISLAHFSLTFARSVAANSINARIRLKTDNNRLRQEIAILIEEARIKDSRMERIPAPRRSLTRIPRDVNGAITTCLRPTRLRNCASSTPRRGEIRLTLVGQFPWASTPLQELQSNRIQFPIGTP